MLQPLLSLASDADDMCRCASAAIAVHALRRLLSAGSGVYQEVYGMARRRAARPVPVLGTCVAAVVHQLSLTPPRISDVATRCAGMLR